MLGRDRGTTTFGVHLIEDRTQLGEGGLDEWLYAPDRMIVRDECIWGDREEGDLAGRPAAHAASWKTWMVTKGETSCW